MASREKKKRKKKLCLSQEAETINKNLCSLYDLTQLIPWLEYLITATNNS